MIHVCFQLLAWACKDIQDHFLYQSRYNLSSMLCMTLTIVTAPRPECTSDPECPSHLACIQEKCQDPCFSTVCGLNAECRASNHRALCVCRTGFVGDPYTVCEERKSNELVKKYLCKIGLCETTFLTRLFPFFFSKQLAAKVTQSVHWHKPVWTGSALIHAFLKSVALMPSALLRTTELSAPASQTSNQILIHTFVASSMSVSLIPIAYQHLPAEMKNVWILVSVPDLLTVLLGTTEECAHAFLDMKEIPMALHAHQVSLKLLPKLVSITAMTVCMFWFAMLLFLVPEPVKDEGCKEDKDCPSKEVCIVRNNRGDCKNPCSTFTPCTANAECKVYDTLPLRTMTCTCLPGFTGKGDQLCSPIRKPNTLSDFNAPI